VAEEAAVVIRAGRGDEGTILKEIAFRSKAHWGYDAARLREWIEGGDFSAAALARLVLLVAEAEGRVIAWASVEPRGEIAWLADLWVEPEWIGQGVGARLFRQAADEARGRGAAAMEWEAEPNALGFYEKMGARPARKSRSDWGRTLSVMRVELDA
jgi:GNAT superfamily N-acetyltransferase